MRLMAVRHGPWKAHFITPVAYGTDKPVDHDPPLLFPLGRDPGDDGSREQRPCYVRAPCRT